MDRCSILPALNLTLRWSRWAFVCGLCALALPAARAAETGLSYTIELQAPPEVRKLIEDQLDLYRWRGNERLDEIQLRRLVSAAPEQVREFVTTEGFYSPQIDAQLQQRNGQWVVSLAVQPGEPVRVAGIDIQVSGPIDSGSADDQARIKKVRDDWSLRAGAVFRHEDWESAKRGALKVLLLERYPTAAITESQATVDAQRKAVDLRVTLDSGPAFTFGALEVKGLQRYPSSLVDVINPIRPGDDYAQAKLLTLQSRLQDSPYFDKASVTVDTDPAHPERVPVRVEVTEHPSRKVDFGIGVSTDTGLRGQIGYRDLDYRDRAWRLSGNLQLESKRQSLNGELQLPTRKSGTTDSLTALVERTDIEGEVTRKLSLGAKRSRVRGSDETLVGLRYLIEQQDIGGVSGDRVKALVPSWSWTRRRVDNLLYPSSGYIINVQTDFALKAVLSDQSFLRGYLRGTFYQPLGKQGQLIVRGELGAVAAKDRQGIPSDFLFRTGGDRTVRGYAFQSLGVEQGDAVVGGRYLAVASAEYVHWITNNYGAAAFVDAGNAADDRGGLKPVLGYGFGARWKSPIGPLNLDLAYGQETQSVRLHLSVGVSF
jgi:translocation and assembly module TamA